MSETQVVNGIKTAVGLSLAGPAGETCIKTRCQNVVPQLLSQACKKEGRGQNARRVCRPLLAACQNDEKMKASCAESCAKYYKGAQLDECKMECMIMHCRVVPEYEECVMKQKIRDVLACMENGEGRQIAEGCLQQRCNLKSGAGKLAMIEES